METITIAVTDLEFERGRDVFADPSDARFRCVAVPAGEEELAAAIRRHGARHAIVGTVRYAGALYEALPRGGVIARYGVGTDGLDLHHATAAGILCTNAPGILDDAVAEHAIGLLLCAARQLPRMIAECRAGTWNPSLGCLLSGRRLAVIGCGAIGSRVAQIAAHGLLMKVTGCDLRPENPAEMRRKFGFDRLTRDFADAVADADFISLHVPSTPATRHFINAERLAMMRADAWLINTARGALVDEAALYDALAAKRLAGAALDVFEHEPYEPAAPG